MSEPMYLCASGLFSSYLADTMNAFVEYKVNVGGCVPESFLPVLKRFDRYCAGRPKECACLDADTDLGFMESQNVKKFHSSPAGKRTAFTRTIHVVRAGDP